MLSLFWGFILTMWYVNIPHLSTHFLQTYRFILTMWYVNLLKPYTLLACLRVLY